MKQKFNRILFYLLNTRATAIYMFLFAFAIGLATFIENDFGTDAAQKHIYSAKWFELLLVLFGLSLIFNIRTYRFIERKKWTLLTFHLAILIILIGAGITRYFGFEGVMPIRQGQTSNVFLSSNAYLSINIFKDGQEYQVEEPVLFSSLGKNSFQKTYTIGSSTIDLNLKELIPNPTEEVKWNDQGTPAINVVIGTPEGRKEHVLVKGDQKIIEGQFFNFTNTSLQGHVNIFHERDSFFISNEVPMTQMVMATQENVPLEINTKYPLLTRSLYQSENHQFVVSSFFMAGDRKLVSKKRKIESGSEVALKMEVSVNGQKETKIIQGQKGNEGMPVAFSLKNTEIRIAYGSKKVTLPFSLKLNYFKMSRYPGTDSPESFLSNVQLIDQEKGINSKEDIYMNHILDHRGYRFFQSSYDQDEQGTYLSVNHDFWGTWISYLGYFLLALGMFLTLFSKNTRFSEIRAKFKSVGNTTLLLIIFATFSGNCLQAQEIIKPKLTVISEVHADLFSRIQVQDIRGRMKPMHTLTREIMRKVHGSESYDGYSADQVVLSMFANNRDWVNLAFIKIGKEERLQKTLGISTEMAAFSDFFNEKGNYKLTESVRNVNMKAEKDRNVYDKLILTVDERVNIMNMVLSGIIFKIVPIEGDKNNTWASNHSHSEGVESKLAEDFFAEYTHEIRHDMVEGNYAITNKLITDLGEYQKKVSGQIMLTDNQVSVEITLNKSKIFNRLALIYVLLGLVFLVLMFVQLFKPNFNIKRIFRATRFILYIFVVLHTLGLLARWYVSGHAPWSNGYESMIYIAWTSALAGIIFTRKTIGGLAATTILAGVVLLIALLSYMNPEITPLVPVLKSYWLTIHVSLEAGSYGFLMLGAVIGILNLLIVASVNKTRLENSVRTIQELTYVSELTITGGLFMLSIGTFLGGIWANESWGRYWGWDAKETWALVSILVYAIILHMRLIPKCNGLVLYNLLTIFGLASVIMTYYGVNYYLSGLHSYAAGDPVPIPNWVYYALVSLIVLASLAFYKKRKYKIH